MSYVALAGDDVNKKEHDASVAYPVVLFLQLYVSCVALAGDDINRKEHDTSVAHRVVSFLQLSREHTGK